MSVIGSNILAGASGQGGGYNLTNSLRFRSSANAYLNRTPANAATSRRIMTYSAWVKLGTLGTQRLLYEGYTSVSDYEALIFNTSNQLEWQAQVNGGTSYGVRTPAVFRDPSAWYHIVCAIDTTQATSTNTVRIYVNGVEQTGLTTFYSGFPAPNTDLEWNNQSSTQVIGWGGHTGYYDGYMTEINMIDGQQLTPSSFGETSATTGVWIPKKFSGTYGTNGFYLKFTDTTSTSTLGTDFSGNSNTWTVNNISLTAGSTYDSMTDVPTLTSATTANYCVLNPISSNASLTLTNGNLSTPSNQDNKANNATIGVSTGKWYWEVVVNNNSSLCPYIGVTSRSQENDPDTSPAFATTIGRSAIRLANPYLYKNYTATSNVSGATNQGTTGTIGVALDLDTGEIKFYNSNTLFHTDTTIPTNGTILFPYIGLTNSGLGGWNSTAFNFGQQPFAYTPPSGFVALNTFNLPTPTIGATASTQANRYMDAITRNGFGISGGSVTTNFQADLIWEKPTNIAQNHYLVDSVRGITSGTAPFLSSNSTSVEQNANWYNAPTPTSISFNSNDWTTSTTLVDWIWRAGGTPAVTNTDGTITSTVSANTTAGFSIFTYTGNNTSGATIGHGLGVKPSFIVVKKRTGTDGWGIYHTSLGATKTMELNTTGGEATSAIPWNNTEPTSSVIYLNGNNYANSSSFTYVMYCFAQVAGYSAFGSYTGNASTDGPFVFTGFRPRWIMIKSSTNASTPWQIFDTSLNLYNTAPNNLIANGTSTLSYDTDSPIDFLSNGFKLRGGSSSWNNYNTGTWIYMAFAETPFKYANAR